MYGMYIAGNATRRGQSSTITPRLRIANVPNLFPSSRCREGRAFAAGARCFRFEILPELRRQRQLWRRRAEAIPDPDLRRAALHTIEEKWSHSEGAAAFAVLLDRPARLAYVRMAIAYELMIDYLDTISEQPVSDPWANTLQLHRAPLNAFSLRPSKEPDYYLFHSSQDDGGFLAAQVKAVRETFVELSSAGLVSERVKHLVALYTEAQARCHVEETGIAASGQATGVDRMAKRHGDLSWDEMWAACNTSVPLFALLALAARPGTSAADVDAWYAAYFPWVASLHILLHSLADEAGDLASGSFNQFGHYRSRREAAGALASIAFRAREELARLPDADTHLTILAGMIGYYLACPALWEEQNRWVAELVLRASTPSVRWATFAHCHGIAG